MKIKYLRLNKNKQKEIRNKFYQTNNGKYIIKQLNIALICSLLCILVSIYLIYDAFINNSNLYDKIYSIIILICGIVGLIAYYKIKIKKLNDYVINNKIN